jgi:hypothetical protein
MSLVWGGVQVSAGVNHLMRGVDLYVFIPNADGTFAVVTEPPAFETVGQDASPPALFSLGQKAAQLLMDDLWHAGLRPTQAAAGDAVLAAKDAHIADLQRLVFGAGMGEGEGAGNGLIGALTQAALAVVLPAITLAEDGTDAAG